MTTARRFAAVLMPVTLIVAAVVACTPQQPTPAVPSPTAKQSAGQIAEPAAGGPAAPAQSPAPQVSGTAPGGRVVIKIGHQQVQDPNKSGVQSFALVFKSLVEGRTGGAIEVRIFPSAQLGGERDLFEGVKMGTVEMAAITDGPVPGFFPDIHVLSQPYLFKNEAVAWHVLDGPFGQELSAALLQKTGVRNLGWGENGFRHFTNKVRRIRSPEDLKGIRMRTMETAAHMAMMKALGANPIAMAWPEVVPGLQQGVIDGQENPVPTIEQNKLDEVQKYLTLDGHLYSPHVLIINDRFFRSLPPDQQVILQEAVNIGKVVARGTNQMITMNAIAELQRRGMDVYFPTAQEKEAFRKATQGPVRDWIISQIGSDWVGKLDKAVREAETDLGIK